jgi:hypothetical protein
MTSPDTTDHYRRLTRDRLAHPDLRAGTMTDDHYRQRIRERLAHPDLRSHFRYQMPEGRSVIVMLARTDDDGWEPLAKFVESGDDDEYTAFPCAALKDLAGDKADLVAYQHMTTYFDLRAEWGRMHPGQPFPADILNGGVHGG